MEVRIVWNPIWGSFTPKTAPKGPPMGTSSQNKNSEKSKLIFNALTDLRQVSQLCVGRKFAYDGLYKNEKFENPRWRRPPSLVSKNADNFRMNEAILTKF